MSPGRRGAERQCVACRRREEPERLVRVVRSPDGKAVVDLRARLPGRGAWVHFEGDCLAAAESKGSLLQRALRGTVDADGLRSEVVAAVNRALLDGLSLASAGGGLVGGRDALVTALQAEEVVELIAADDAAERTLRELIRAAGSGLPCTTLPLDRDALGAQVGAGARAALGVRPIHVCTHLRRQLQRLRLLG
ncbi:MAG: DUF448 domain-containing protein [Myxococcales bacterium]|nr:DUF448 domain-containing protein [Myxococcales bacterium]